MPFKTLNLNNLGDDEDMLGNNAAFRCPVMGCGKVFINTTHMKDGVRKCPKCGQSKVTLNAQGGRGTKVIEAVIEWD